MFIFCSWPVWYNVYNVYLSWHYSYQFQWRVMTFFCKKIWFTFHFSFFLNTCSMFAREYWVFPFLVLFYVHWTFIMNEKLSQNIVLFYICMYCKNSFVFAPFYLLKLKNKICFLLALIKLCITFNTPKRSKYLHNLRKYRRPSLSYCSYRRTG